MNVVHSGFDALKFTIQTDITPELRRVLIKAKENSIRTNCETVVEVGGVALSVRRSGTLAFSAHTGEYGAEWYFLDPKNRPKNNPGVTVDFRAFLLATGGIAAAKAHFYECLEAFGIPFVDAQIKVSRIDFAIDILAPWFEPDRTCLVAPPGTRVSENADLNKNETTSNGVRVTGLRAGAVANRQIAIYDKRSEIIQKGKMGWLEIWNYNRKNEGLPPLDLSDRSQSLVWRFELRMGSKQLRRKWEMRGWDDLDAMVGDALALFCEQVSYRFQTADSNRSRWPIHELWEIVTGVISNDLRYMRSGVVPEDVKTANRAEHKRMLDGQILGLLVARAAAGEVGESGFDAFIAEHIRILKERSREHPTPIDERLAKAASRYRFR